MQSGIVKNEPHLEDYEIQIGDCYVLNAKKKLGSGAFGVVYLGYNIKLKKEVAIKLESTKSRHPQLFYESKLYIALQGGEGIPNFHWCGTQGSYNILIIDSLGPSLEELFVSVHKKFTIKTTLMVTEQILNRIEFIHSRNFIHRDIKPDNFLIGRGKTKNIIYSIDFGLAKRYKDPRTGIHIPYKDGKSLTGTARYTSVNTHLGIEQARRDDIESIGYIMVYFLRGGLPWQGLKAKNKKEKYEKIKEKKLNTPLEILCNNLPGDIITWIGYAKGLNFEEKPDYNYLQSLIQKMARENSITFDQYFDWIIKEKNDKEKEEQKDI